MTHRSDDDPLRAQVEKERDFYKKLLDLGNQEDIEPFLDEALGLITDISGAERGYIELTEERDPDGAPRFSMAHGCDDDDVEEIRGLFSSGVIAAAMATGTIVSESALDDPRFMKNRSVVRNQTGAVLCAPIGAPPPIGVLYLQDRAVPGPFTAADRDRVERFAKHIAKLAAALLVARRREAESDPTAPFRRILRAEGFIGRSAAAARLLKQIAQAAPLDITVLLRGEPGIGKTQLARILHDSGPRAAGPFVEVSCPAIPETLFEGELFGAEAGAYTGATQKREGKIQAARRGTLFLDDIGDLPLSVQPKLLKFLQSRRYSRVGSTVDLEADVRVIAATNVDLEDLVRQRLFRQDLFDRLQVMPVRVPSLSDRRDDVPILADHFLRSFCDAAPRPRLCLSPGALYALGAAEWPGNIRQLANTIEAAFARASFERVDQIEVRHLFPDEEAEGGADAPRLTFQEATRRFQKQLVERTLAEAEWKITAAAERLDLSRAHMHNLIAAFGLERPKG